MQPFQRTRETGPVTTRRSERGRRYDPVRLLALGLAVLLASSRPARSLPDEEDRWIRVETAHFTLFSNASPDHTIQVGRRLELFRLALSRFEPGLTVHSPQPTAIYVFRDDASFRPYKKRFGGAVDDLAGYFVAERDGNYVGLNASPRGNPFAPVYHEYVHYFINNNFPNVPLWFNEGIAECFSTFRPAGSKLEIGRPIETYIERLEPGPLLPLRRLLAVDTSSPEYNERDRTGVFYAQSWALVHYLLWGEPNWASSLEEHLADLDENANLPALLGLPDHAAVEGRLRRYLRERRFARARIDAGGLAVDGNARTIPLARAEAVYRLGDLLAHLGPGHAAAAERHFREALRLDRGLASAWTGLGYLRDLRGRHDEAAGFYDRALALDRGDPLTHFLYATSIMERHYGDRRRHRRPLGLSKPPHLERARALFAESIRLRPDLPEAYAGLGATYAFDEADLEAGIAALEEARRRLPARMDVVFNLIGLYARQGEPLAARALLDVLARAGDPDLLADARESILQGDLVAAARHLEQGRVDDSLRLLRRVRSRTADRELRSDLDAQIARIERIRKTNELIDAYNRAVDLVTRRRFEEAAAILRRVLAETDDDRLRRSASTLLSDLEHVLAGAPPRP